MHGFRVLYGFVATAFTVLMVAAIISRLTSMKDGPKYVTNAGDALVRLFTGAFGND